MKYVLPILLVTMFIVSACASGDAVRTTRLAEYDEIIPEKAPSQEKLAAPTIETLSPEECWEPDAGDHYVKGINGQPEVPWAHVDLGFDHCVKTELSTLYEARCGTYELVDCPYGCFNGRCVGFNETCQEGWYCDGPYARSYLSSNCTWINYQNSTNSSTICSNGQWEYVDPLPRYWDLDDKDLGVFDYVYDFVDDEPERYDYCVGYSDQDRIVEYYATTSGGSPSSWSYSCENGCFNGRCTEVNETCPAGWYCYNFNTRYHVDENCHTDDFEWGSNPNDDISETVMCSGGEFVNTCGDGYCMEFYEEDCGSCPLDCGTCPRPGNRKIQMEEALP